MPDQDRLSHFRPTSLATEGKPLDTGRRAPAITDLDDGMLELAHLLVHGLEADDEIEGKPVKAGWPLTLRQAARYLGVRLKRSRDIAEAPVFAAELAKQLKARRNSELARNLETAVRIRDDEGLGLAADRTVRLKAIGVIEGTEGKGVNIQINNNNGAGGQAINPGYVIQLMPLADADVPAAPAAPRPMLTIEGTATRIDPQPPHEPDGEQEG